MEIITLFIVANPFIVFSIILMGVVLVGTIYSVIKNIIQKYEIKKH